MEFTLETALAALEFLDAKTQNALAAAGFVRVEQRLRHYPFRHEDRRQAGVWPGEATPGPVCVSGLVTGVQLKKHGYRRAFVEVTIDRPDGAGLSGPVLLRWFNMAFIHKACAADQEIVVFGK